MATMRIFLYYLISIFLVLGAISCKKTDNTDRILTIAEQIVEQFPDSTLTLLDSIPTPFMLNDKRLNKYWLLQIQAKDKLYGDIASDTIIFKVRDYYKKKKDIENTALSSFYCGRVLHEQGKHKEAMEEYLKTDEYAGKTKNTNLKGLSQSLIGETLLNELLQTEAIEHFKVAAQYFHEAKNIKNEIISYKLIGNAFLMNSISDSAFYYYDKGLRLAEVNNDSMLITSLIHNIGIVYQETGRYESAVECFRSTAEYVANSDNKIKLYLNISKTFYGIGMLDSAKVYADKSLSLLPDSTDVLAVAGIYKTLFQIAEKQADFKQSLEYYKEYVRNLENIFYENKNKDMKFSKNERQLFFEKDVQHFPLREEPNGTQTASGQGTGNRKTGPLHNI